MECKGPDVLGSYDELYSAFGNLASNAVRYTPAGGTITLRWQDGPAGPQFIAQDTGIGISQEHISRLTERFYRVDKSRSRETQGTGLGLAIVKHVLLRHGGHSGHPVGGRQGQQLYRQHAQIRRHATTGRVAGQVGWGGWRLPCFLCD